MFKEFNINQNVRVKLTEKGIKILKDDYDVLLSICPGLPKWDGPLVDENGYTRFQCWDLMKRFGNHVTIGSDLPFETDILVDIEEK